MPCGMFFAQGSRMKGFDEALLELHWGSSPQMQGAQPWLQSSPHPLGTSEELAVMGKAMNACGDLGDQGPGELCLLRNGFLGYKTITMEQRKVRQQLTGPVPISLAGRGLPSCQRNTRTWGSQGLTINLRPVMAFLVHSWHCLCLVSAYTPAQALQGMNPVQVDPALVSLQHCLNLGCSSVHHRFRFAILHLYHLTRRQCGESFCKRGSHLKFFFLVANHFSSTSSSLHDASVAWLLKPAGKVVLGEHQVAVIFQTE